jgi:predicted GNAT family acetyltransferase
MEPEVLATDDPARALDSAGPFLASDPVRHNVILTLLHRRIAHPEPGRYWVVSVGGEPVGFVFQSPLDFVATLTPMPDTGVTAVVDAIVGAGVVLPGVNGEAAAAARFAGQWTERNRSAAQPVQGHRIYEVRKVVAPRPIGGQLRRATSKDRELLVAWFRAFQEDIGESASDLGQVVDRRLAAGELWLWDDAGATTLAGLSEPVADVVRVGPVYTPPAHRNRGYASSCVAGVSERVLCEGLRCILYTDLDNPTSNSIYRSLGYQAVAEALRYRFA